MKIIDFVKALLPRIGKDKLLEDLRITISELDQVVSTSYQYASDYFKTSKLQSDDNKELSDVFYRNFDLQSGGKQSSFIADINRRLPYIKENALYIQALVEEIMDHDIINEGLTAKKAVVIRAADSLSFITRYSVDLLNLVYVNEAIAVNADTTENMQLAPAVIKHIRMNIAQFAGVLSDYGIPNKDFSKILGGIPEVIISSKTTNSLIGSFNEKDLDPFSSAYASGIIITNPIYCIRLLVAEWQANRYKNNKDKKKMLELRLLHLKLLQEKKDDPKVEQEINYIQSRIDKIDKYLRDVDESLDEGAE